MTDAFSDERWHLSKAVPVSIILFLMAQSLAVVIWAVKLDSRVGVLETSQLVQDAKLSSIEKDHTAVIIFDNRMKTIEQRLDVQSQKLQAMLELLTKQITPQH